MKYNIYDTEALVLKSFIQGEESRTVMLLTKEFGCLYAHAQGVRKIQSKLRFGTVESSLVSVGLLSGKSGWRITYLVPHENFYFSLRKNYAAQNAVVKIMSVCTHLVGEGKDNQEIFNTVVNGFHKMLKNTNKKEEVCIIERMIMLKILFILGYVEYSVYSQFVFDREKEITSNFLQRKITQEINKALEVAW
jgi:recombinational DNA repair protein (RecF pathway)